MALKVKLIIKPKYTITLENELILNVCLLVKSVKRGVMIPSS